MSQSIVLVEGSDDRYVLEFLFKYYCPGHNLTIKYVKGSDNFKAELRLRLKAEEISAIGIVVDADHNSLSERLADIRNWADNSCLDDLPEIQPGGILKMVERPDGLSPFLFGIWCMPDNQSAGQLEDFIFPLVPKSPFWDYAETACLEAKRLGAPFSEAHLKKARLRTWLAWQKPPGLAPGRGFEKGLFHLPLADDKGSLVCPLMEWLVGLAQGKPQ